jgi:N-acetylglucosamine-6-phosphate deacetylase
MIVLAGAHLVLPDRLLSPGTLVVEDGRIADVRPGTLPRPSRSLEGHYVLPGFIDVHVHGLEGVDSLDGEGAIDSIAERLPRYGVTSFCPTTVACSPPALRAALGQVKRARGVPPRGARVLPAHLESNFISVDYRGAQPRACLRDPAAALDALGRARDRPVREDADFDGADILFEIERATAEVGIVTIAPELDGGLDLVRWLAGLGLRVSLGHSGATYEAANAAIAAGARHATHLFNRMPPLDQRSPGLVGAILQSDGIAAELICDGTHVHPAMLRMAIRLKRPDRVMAITDGTAAAGLPLGARASLGGQAIAARENAAYLDDGTVAGSVLTMDRAFRLLVENVGVALPDAAVLCSATAARELGLRDRGVLEAGAAADLVVLDSRLSVVETYVAGQLVYSTSAT